MMQTKCRWVRWYVKERVGASSDVRVRVRCSQDPPWLVDASRIILVILQRVEALAAPVVVAGVDTLGERIEPGVDGHEMTASLLRVGSAEPALRDVAGIG